MKVTVKLFSIFIDLFGAKEKEIDLADGASIQDLLNLLCDNQKCREKIFDDSGKVRTHIQIIKNRRPVRSLDGINTPLADNDSIGILPPVFGG
jgi:molybdopterin synthase sulfur carrier subunit